MTTSSSIVEVVDRDVWARALIDAKKRTFSLTPGSVDLAEMITGITVQDTMSGSSTMTITLVDEGCYLLDIGFFDPNDDGKLDAVEVNYPADSPFWWRLTQASVAIAGGGAEIELTFMERAAVFLQELKGPVKVSRAKKTRAEFMKQLSDKVTKGGGLSFYSKELTKKQPIGSDEDRTDRKAGGIPLTAKLTVKNSGRASRAQIKIMNQVLDAAVRYGAGPKATLALVVGCIVENEWSNSGVINDPGSTSVGVLQAQYGLSAGASGRTMTRAQCLDIDYTVKSFLTGPGFASKGSAIKLARDNPTWSAGRIAQTVLASAFPDRYDLYLAEGRRVIAAYGGVGAGGGNADGGSYNFEVGGPNDPRENFWDAMNRLAEEVNWRFFLDGNKVYFDDEYTLIGQQPSLVVDRSDEFVVSVSGTWDSRNVVSEVTLDLVCDAFEFRAGQVFQLENFGPLSTGSSAKLPGRWLVSEVSRTMTDTISSFTLKQPTKPKPEPASNDDADTNADGSSSAGDDLTSSMTPKQVIDQIVLPIARRNGINRSVAQNDAANRSHGPTSSGGVSDHQGPPSKRWAADISNGSSPTKEMDAVARALAQRFGLSWSGSGAVSGTKSGFRFQLIYRSNVGGNHFNHVHIGVAKQ